MKIYNVSELNTEARQAMLLAFEYPISVKGELSDYRTSRGHQYFKLRDNVGTYTVSCVMWKGSPGNTDLSKYLHMDVVVTAKVDFYAGFGQFQLNIVELSEFGDGFLKNEIEKIKKKLSNEGIFDIKKSLPKFPKKIAVLTAKDSHALKDVCSKLNEKYPLAEIIVYPSIVQGLEAPKNLIYQIKRINRDSLVDVILIVRGGGSFQDLMAFNDENLVREISKSEIPTITGVGHKPDITLADYASDSAQETPTAAAICAVPDCQMLKQDIDYFENSIGKLINSLIIRIESKLRNYLVIIRMINPIKAVNSLSKDFTQSVKVLKKSIKNKINIKQTCIKDENQRDGTAIRRIVVKIKDHIKTLNRDSKSLSKLLNQKISLQEDLLDAKKQQVLQMNPNLLLKKGYAIVRKENKTIVKSIDDVSIKNNLSIELSDGLIKVKRKE